MNGSPRPPSPPIPPSPHEWYAAVPPHCRLGAQAPWLMYHDPRNYRGVAMPEVYFRIAGRHLAYLYQQVGRLFDAAVDRAYAQHRLPVHPSTNIFEPAPGLYDVFSICATVVDPSAVTHEQALCIANFEIAAAILKHHPDMQAEAERIVDRICDVMDEITKSMSLTFF